METNEYRARLAASLAQRRIFLETNELPRLRDECRAFHKALAAVYGIFAKKGYINADPYKDDTPVTALKRPNLAPLTEANRRERLGALLADLDNQFDYLAESYRMTVDNLGQDKVKLILALVRCVDWQHVTPQSASPASAAIAAILGAARKTLDPASAEVLSGALRALNRGTDKIIASLRVITSFNKEAYKDAVRRAVTNKLSRAAAAEATIKWRLAEAAPGLPFYAEFVNEIILEDFDDDKELRARALKSLEGNREKAARRRLLLEGLEAISEAGMSLEALLKKAGENHTLLQKRKRGPFRKRWFRPVRDPDAAVYAIEYVNPANVTLVREKLVWGEFSAGVKHRAKILNAITLNSAAARKVAALSEAQLFELLRKNIQDTQLIYKRLSGLDDYYKEYLPRSRKGRAIALDLSSFRNAISAARTKFHAYQTRKEKEAGHLKKERFSAET